MVVEGDERSLIVIFVIVVIGLMVVFSMVVNSYGVGIKELICR